MINCCYILVVQSVLCTWLETKGSRVQILSLSLGYTGTESAANTPEISNLGGFGSILFSLPEWVKIQEGFWSILGGIRLVLKCSKPAEYPKKWSRIWPRQISFQPYSTYFRMDSGKHSGHSRQVRAYPYFKLRSSPNQRRISSKSTKSIWFWSYLGKISLNLFERIRFWCNPCIGDF